MRSFIVAILAASASARATKASQALRSKVIAKNAARAYAGGATGGSSAAASKLLWVQHEDTAVYTSSGLSRHLGSTPTFATAVSHLCGGSREPARLSPALPHCRAISPPADVAEPAHHGRVLQRDGLGDEHLELQLGPPQCRPLYVHGRHGAPRDLFRRGRRRRYCRAGELRPAFQLQRLRL